VSGTEESRQTAIKAAYFIGRPAREVFLWIAAGPSRELAKTAVYALYLRWSIDPEFVYELLDELGSQVGLVPIGRSARILRFLSDLSITIYINHPERQDVIDHTSDLWYRVLKERMHLDSWVSRSVSWLVFRVVAAVFSKRALDTALLSELQSPEAFFRQSEAQRQQFRRAADLVEPEASLEGSQPREDLAALLKSDILIHNILADLVIAIHAIKNPSAADRLLHDIVPDLGGPGTLTATQAFSVLLPDTPPEWVDTLEWMTSGLVEHRDTFLSGGGSLSSHFDIALLPLGLAYGKREGLMPLVDRLLQDALGNDIELAARIVRGLAPVGFYYPEAVFRTLLPVVESTPDSPLFESLVLTLATMRILHFDAVDLFLGEVGASEALRAEVRTRADLRLVQRYIAWLGYYNNAVHQAIHYPKMREQLLVGGLRALADAREPRSFIRTYTPIPLRMLRAADYHLVRWTTLD